MDKRLLELELGIRAETELFGIPLHERKNPFGDNYSTTYDTEKKMQEDYIKRITEDSE